MLRNFLLNLKTHNEFNCLTLMAPSVRSLALNNSENEITRLLAGERNQMRRYIVCPLCATEMLPENEFCFDCTQFVNQDHVYQRELPLPPRDIEQLEASISGRPVNSPWALEEKPANMPSIKWMTSRSKLSSAQKAVIEMIYEKKLSLEQISLRLGISRTSVHERHQSALKKLKNTLTRIQWVGKSVQLSSIPATGSTNSTADEDPTRKHNRNQNKKRKGL